MPNLSGPMSLGVSSVTVRPVRGSVFVQKLAHMAQRGPVVGRRRREQSERFAVAGGPTQFDDAVGDALSLCARAARRCPHRGSVIRARAFGLHCPLPPGYAFRAPFQGRSIHWVTWAGTPLF
jgi:hypothetical protein